MSYDAQRRVAAAQPSRFRGTAISRIPGRGNFLTHTVRLRHYFSRHLAFAELRSDNFFDGAAPYAPRQGNIDGYIYFSV